MQISKGDDEAENMLRYRVLWVQAASRVHGINCVNLYTRSADISFVMHEHFFRDNICRAFREWHFSRWFALNVKVIEQVERKLIRSTYVV